jgi:hypothetical protein
MNLGYKVPQDKHRITNHLVIPEGVIHVWCNKYLCKLEMHLSTFLLWKFCILLFRLKYEFPLIYCKCFVCPCIMLRVVQ